MIDKIKEKIKRYENKDAIHVAATITNFNTFSELEAINTGKDVVICGAGPSLANYHPLEEAVHVALNRAILYEKVKYEYLFANDWIGIAAIQDYIRDYDCKKYYAYYIGTQSERAIPQDFAYRSKAKRYYCDGYYISSGYNSNFVVDINHRAIGNMPNSALQVLPIILYTNPKKVYLVGCDSVPGHYKEELFRKYEDRIKRDESCLVSKDTLKKWKEFKRFAKVYYPNVEIVSINPVGLKGLFEDIYQ